MELMLIREVEERCGISKKNIRFYEQQGLLQPKRNASNYREYEEADFIAIVAPMVVDFKENNLTS